MKEDRKKALQEADDPAAEAILEVAEEVDGRVKQFEERLVKNEEQFRQQLKKQDELLDTISDRFEKMQPQRGPAITGGNPMREVIPENKRHLIGHARQVISSTMTQRGMPTGDTVMHTPEDMAAACLWFSVATKAQCSSRYALEMTQIRTQMDQIEKAFVEKYGGMTSEEMKASYAEGTDSTGGYLVPTPVAAEILRIAIDTAVVAPKCRQMPMVGKQMEIPNEATGVTVYWGSEAGTLTRGENTLGINLLDAKRLHGAATMSIEVLEDSIVGLTSYINQIMAEKIGWELDQELLEGDGTNFTGLNAESGINTVATTTGDAEAIVYDDIAMAIGAPNEASTEANSQWFMNKKMWSACLKIKDDNGFPILSQVPFSGAPTMAMLGYPVHKTSAISAFRTSGSNTSTSNIYFGDPRRIILGTRQDLRWQVTEFGPGWDTYQVDARLVGRFASTVGTPAAFVKITKGTHGFSS
jgi:HK97 family phage major capsid protein